MRKSSPPATKTASEGCSAAEFTFVLRGKDLSNCRLVGLEETGEREEGWGGEGRKSDVCVWTCVCVCVCVCVWCGG